jgi:hypothetical protein
VTIDHETIKRAQFNIPATDNNGQTNTILAYTDLTKGTASGSATQLYDTRANAPLTEAVVDFPNSTPALMQSAAAAWFNERHKPLQSGSFELAGGGTATHNTLGFLQGYSARLFTADGYTAVRAGSTVTITSTAAHLLSTGNTVVMAGITGTAGTSMNGTFSPITVTSGSAFTYTAAGSSGAGTTSGPGSAVVGTGIGYRLVSWAPGQFVDITAASLGLSGLYRVEEVALGFEPASFSQKLAVVFNRKNPADITSIIAAQRGS